MLCIVVIQDCGATYLLKMHLLEHGFHGLGGVVHFTNLESTLLQDGERRRDEWTRYAPCPNTRNYLGVEDTQASADLIRWQHSLLTVLEERKHQLCECVHTCGVSPRHLKQVCTCTETHP